MEGARAEADEVLHEVGVDLATEEEEAAEEEGDEVAGMLRVAEVRDVGFQGLEEVFGVADEDAGPFPRR